MVKKKKSDQAGSEDLGEVSDSDLDEDNLHALVNQKQKSEPSPTTKKNAGKDAQDPEKRKHV